MRTYATLALATLLLAPLAAPVYAQQQQDSRDQQQQNQQQQNQQQQDQQQQDQQQQSQQQQDRQRQGQQQQNRQRQGQQRQQDQQPPDQRRRDQQRTERQGRARVTGEVVRTKRVDVRGADRQHLVVMLRTQRGNRPIADLGPVDQLGPALPEEGERITVEGRVVQIGDRRVLVGERLQAGERTVRIDRRPPAQLRQRQGQRQQRGQQAQSRQDQRREGQRPGGLGVRLAYARGVQGVPVLRVVPGSPADRAGIRRGDVISFVEDEFVTTPQQLIEAVGEKQPGKPVTFLVRRDGERRRVTVELATRQQALRARPLERGEFDEYR